MKEITCFIVDDEPIAIDILRNYLQKMNAIQVAGTFTNPVLAFEALQQQSVDLLFLDIQMPELNGLELLQSLNHRPAVILTTAYREFALEGFNLDVVDYLLKPIAFNRFLNAIDKFMARRVSNTERGVLPGASEGEDAPHFFVRSDRKNVKVYLREILYLESLKDYVRIVTATGKLLTKETISHFEEILPSAQFLRVHRSFIVAKDKISALSADGLEINKTTIPIGRLYKLNVEKAVLGSI